MSTIIRKKYRVWHIPQVPGKPFIVETDDPLTAYTVLKTLAEYDLFQFEHNIKPDYSNASGVMEWDDVLDPDDEDEDERWSDVDPDIFSELLDSLGVPVEESLNLL
jgi:hypothetical protein